MANNQNISGARYSAINSMHHCPLWAYLIYKEKLIGYKNPFAKFGIMLHNVLEDYAKHCIANHFDTDYAEFEKIKFKHMVNLEESQFADAKNVLETIKNNTNWSSYLQFDTVEIEQRFAVDKNFKFTTSENPYLSGGIDLIYIDDDTAYIEDYKSVRAIYTKSFMQDSLQRKIYPLLVLEKYPHINNTAFRFNFIRHGYQSEYFYINREELPELKAQIKEEVDALDALLKSSERPEPCAGGHCVLCENRAQCPAYHNAFTIDEQIYSKEDAIKLYQHYKLAKLKVNNMEETLKLWINENGPVRMKYEEYGPQISPKVEYKDLQQVIKIMEEAGVPIGAIYDKLSLSNTKVKEISKKFKLSDTTKQAIDKLAKISQITKYATKKIEEESSEDEESAVTDLYI